MTARVDRAAGLKAVIATIQAATGAGHDACTAIAAAAGADRDRISGILARYLAANPGALQRPAPTESPYCLTVVAQAIAAAGYPAPAAARCGRCGRTEFPLTRCKPEGRVCQPCARNDDRPRACVRCGRTVRTLASKMDGGLCEGCYRRDPGRLQRCSGCGVMRMPKRRLPDGSPLCERCHGRPTGTCSRCGSTGRLKSRQDNAICQACYDRYERPARPCRSCGRLRKARKRNSDGTYLCRKCYRGPTGTCGLCGRVQAGYRRNGLFLCEPCQPRPTALCARCGTLRTVKVRWPDGPVCPRCYYTARVNPKGCVQCGQVQVLVSQLPDGGRCGLCCGIADFGSRCKVCAEISDLYEKQICARCVASGRLRSLLTHPPAGVPHPSHADVLCVVLQCLQPRSVIALLRRGHARQVLTLLAVQGSLTHADLDEIGAHQGVCHLRNILVLARVLPARNEYLERLGPWLQRCLREHPAHRHIVGPYAQWHVLHRARRRATRLGRTTSQTAGIRSAITAAIGLLAWLADRDIDIGDLRQPDVDKFLESSQADRHHTRAFLRWSSRRRLSPHLDVPVPGRAAPSDFLTSEDRWLQLELCLSAPDIPVAIRFIGALMLLYGLRASQLLRLTTDAVAADGSNVYLKVGPCPLQLPPVIATLARDLARQQEARHAVRLDDGPRWLFTSRWRLHPLTPGNVAYHLRRHGIYRQAGRNTALLDLAADMPAAVIAPMLGLTRNTMVTWNGYARMDGNAYLRARRQHQRGSIPLAGS